MSEYGLIYDYCTAFIVSFIGETRQHTMAEKG